MSKRRSKRIPTYRQHKGTGQAVVTLDGRDHYLGRYGTPESKERYDRLIAEWLAAGRKMPIQPGPDVTVTELCAAYWRHAQQHYRKKDGTPTTRLGIAKDVIRTLRRVYGSVSVTEFGPRSLVALRQVWLDGRHRPKDAIVGRNEPLKPLTRTTINNYVSQVKLIFKFGVREELVNASIHDALRAVPGLSAGRSDARETEGVKPVPAAHINAIKPYVSRQIWSLIQLQLLTAARGGELLIMRAVDIDTTGTIWTYKPSSHKTQHKGKERTIFIGPRAQDVIKPFLAGRALDAYLFSPIEAERERHAQAETHRRPDQKPSPRQTDRTIGDRYTTPSYRKAVERACDDAGVPKWTPHRLRHSAATHIRKEFGLEAARIILGHTHAGITEIYAERDAEKAIEVIAKIG